MKTQATTSTSELLLLLEQAIKTRLSTALIVSQRKWRCLKGAVLNIKFGPFYVFSRVFLTPPRYDYPLDAILVVWQYKSRIRGGLLYHKTTKESQGLPFGLSTGLKKILFVSDFWLAFIKTCATQIYFMDFFFLGVNGWVTDCNQSNLT